MKTLALIFAIHTFAAHFAFASHAEVNPPKFNLSPQTVAKAYLGEITRTVQALPDLFKKYMSPQESKSVCYKAERLLGYAIDFQANRSEATQTAYQINSSVSSGIVKAGPVLDKLVKGYCKAQYLNNFQTKDLAVQVRALVLGQ